MNIPGLPLIYINEGFKAVTGYGKEKITISCRFLQGPTTPQYLNEEICEALRHQENLYIKIYNYKANKEEFQNCLGLFPVFGPQGEYKYQIGIQLDFKMSGEITKQLLEQERILRYMPNSMTCQDPKDIARCIPSDYMGDLSLYPFVKFDVSQVAAQPSMGYGGGYTLPPTAAYFPVGTYSTVQVPTL